MKKAFYLSPEVKVYPITLEGDILTNSFNVSDWDNDGTDYGGECWD